MHDKWEIYKGEDNLWRWRCTAPNGNITGASTQGYVNKADCEGNARRNGWKDDSVVKKKKEPVKQKDGNKEKKEPVKQKDGSKEQKDIKSKQLRNLLLVVIGTLWIIIAILLFSLFWENPKIELSEKSLSEPQVTLLVLDPKADEKVVVFGDTHFSFNKSVLSPEAKTLLDKDVETLKENPGINVRMAGYTSAKGTESVNQKISEKRAHAVRNYLIEKGIAPERITTIGYGRTRPALYEVSPSDINSKEAQANMRVLFEIVVK